MCKGIQMSILKAYFSVDLAVVDDTLFFWDFTSNESKRFDFSKMLTDIDLMYLKKSEQVYS